MIEGLLIGTLASAILCLILLIVLLKRPIPGQDSTPERLAKLETAIDRVDRALREEMGQNRSESAENGRLLREELARTLGDTAAKFEAHGTQLRQDVTQSITSFRDGAIGQIREATESQKERLDGFAKRIKDMTDDNERRMTDLRQAVEQKLKDLQADNTQKLEEMRQTVSEKLEGTLERRLGESFTQVSERLDHVHRGLGEMRKLASDVGDLQKVLSNVKSRGTWGEVQLGNLLEQILTPDQYAKNVPTNANSNERVEFAIRMPGPGGGLEQVWLPVDAKCPVTEYQRIVDAAEANDAAALIQARKQFEQQLRGCARTIREKYINPPNTTDFAILFAPTEGLYAEILRSPGLAESIQQDQRIIIVGPTVLAAFLNALQMGFRTLAIERRSSEVWEVLSAVKTEFGRFGEVFNKVKKKLSEASDTVEKAERRTRAMGRRLKTVEELPVHEAAAVLDIDDLGAAAATVTPPDTGSDGAV